MKLNNVIPAGALLFMALIPLKIYGQINQQQCFADSFKDNHEDQGVIEEELFIQVQRSESAIDTGKSLPETIDYSCGWKKSLLQNTIRYNHELEKKAFLKKNNSRKSGEDIGFRKMDLFNVEMRSVQEKDLPSPAWILPFAAVILFIYGLMLDLNQPEGNILGKGLIMAAFIFLIAAIYIWIDKLDLNRIVSCIIGLLMAGLIFVFMLVIIMFMSGPFNVGWP